MAQCHRGPSPAILVCSQVSRTVDVDAGKTSGKPQSRILSWRSPQKYTLWSAPLETHMWHFDAITSRALNNKEHFEAGPPRTQPRAGVAFVTRTPAECQKQKRYVKMRAVSWAPKFLVQVIYRWAKTTVKYHQQNRLCAKERSVNHDGLLAQARNRYATSATNGTATKWIQNDPLHPRRVYYSLVPPKFSHLYLLLTCASTTHLRLRPTHLRLRPTHLRLHFLFTYASLLSTCAYSTILLLIENVYAISFHNAMILNLVCYLNFIPPCLPQCQHLKSNSLFKLPPLPSTMPSSKI